MFYEVPLLKSAPVNTGRGPKVNAQYRADVTSRDDPAKLGAEFAIGESVYTTLQNHYPGHFWNVELTGGMVKIGIPPLLGQWTYNFPARHLTHWRVIEAGGHILERFNIPRSTLDVAAFVNARNTKAIRRANQRPPE